MIHTLLFDLDGTLIDTEKYYRRFWRESLRSFGYEMTDEQALSMRSLGRPFAVDRLKEMYGEDLDYPKVRNKRIELMNACIEENGIDIKSGVVELLTYLRENDYKTAVVTATNIERTTKYLKETGLYDFFDDVISAVMVMQGKPAPDVYLYACEQLGVSPSDCIAVEDSPNGVTSAWSAGCNVIMVPDQTQPDEELAKKLFAKVDTMDKIINILQV